MSLLQSLLGGNQAQMPGDMDPMARQMAELEAARRALGIGTPGEIREGPGGRNYQFAQTTGMAGATGDQGWIPTSMKPEPSGLSRLLQPEVALPMAAALLGNQGNMANLGNAFGAAGTSLTAQKAEQKKQAELNKTLEFFKTNAPEYAQMVASGMPIGDAWKTYTEQRFAQNKAPASVQEYEYAKNTGAFDGTFTDWQTKGVREQDKGFKNEQDLRKEYGATPEYKRYDDVRAAYERVRSSASMDSGAGDIGTIFGFMKMLDPGSVVREGEFATAQNSSGVPDRIRNTYNSIISGERLTPEQRAEFVRTSDALYSNEAKRIEGLNQRYGSIANEWQLDPGRIVQEPAKFDPIDPLGIR